MTTSIPNRCGAPALYLLYLFFLLQLVVPTTFQMYRGVLLAVLVMYGSGIALKRWRIVPDILFLWLFSLLVGISAIFWGYINGAPGAIRVSTVYFLWPIIYMLLVGLATPILVVSLNRTLVWGVAVASGMALAVFLAALLGQAATVTDWLSFQGAGVGIYDGYVELTLFNLATVIYGLPFLVASLFIKFESGGPYRQRWTWVLLGIVLLVCLVSGRRGFWLVALVSPLIVFGLAVFAGFRLHWGRVGSAAALLVAMGAVGVWTAEIDPATVAEQFGNAFSGQYQSSGARFEQWSAMSGAFSESPLIGHGLGAVLKSVRRSEQMAWAYELYYGALLFKIGLLGLAIYGLAVFWIFFAGVRLVRRVPEAAPVVLPLLAGLAAFLLITATNPYLTKFDYLWTIFLPVAAINAYHHKMPSATSSSSTGTPVPSYESA